MKMSLLYFSLFISLFYLFGFVALGFTLWSA
ncbi:hypothetical protein Enr8_49290 [Blastopirellula retiformator]|uniref:Uncharacterized protein n=1 Tax=Blastopirellula retiformator TaxID=2527970 RepID=A0A5C5UUX6_9BACT|nr:hypothetical protein Enr8_49290 [Blastopirellula retiformator]